MKRTKLLSFILCFIMLFSSVNVFASGWNHGKEETKPLNSSQFIFNQKNPDILRKYGSYGNRVFTLNYLGGSFPIYMPFVFGSSEDPEAVMSKYILENKQTSLGHGGQHLLPGELNKKKGSKDPSIYGAQSYRGDNTGNVWSNKHNMNIEFRYAGYLNDATVVDNPLFPDDVYANIHPADKNWLKFGAVANHKKTFLNTDFDLAEKTFNTWFSTTEIGARFKAKTPAAYKGNEWKYWNQYFQIQSDINQGSGIITGWHNRNGHLYYETFAIPSMVKTK